MEEFLKTRNNGQLKHLLLSSLAAHRKLLNEMFMHQNRNLNGYTPTERLAYIVHLQDYKTMKELNSLFKSISIGTASLRSKQFDDFLMKYSNDKSANFENPQDADYDDDFSDSDSCVEEITIG